MAIVIRLSLFGKLEVKLKSWIKTIYVLICTSGFGTIFCGTIHVVINRPGGPFMLVIANWSACMGRARTIYVLPGPFMPMHKWSGRTKYDDISGPARPSMLS